MKVKLKRDCRVAMLTFGGKEIWTAQAAKTFLFDRILESNEAFTIVQSGLNWYVFESAALEAVQE